MSLSQQASNQPHSPSQEGLHSPLIPCNIERGTRVPYTSAGSTEPSLTGGGHHDTRRTT